MPVQSEQQFGSQDVNLWGNLIMVIIVLALIIVLILLFVRFLGKRNKFLSQNHSIRILGAVGLGPNKSLQVIEIGSSIYLVGVGEDISILDKISEPDAVVELRRSFEEEGAKFDGFSSLLSGFVSRFRKEPEHVEEELEGTSFHELLYTQLNNRPNRKRQMEQLLKDEDDQSIDRLRDYEK